MLNLKLFILLSADERAALVNFATDFGRVCFIVYLLKWLKYFKLISPLKSDVNERTRSAIGTYFLI